MEDHALIDTLAETWDSIAAVTSDLDEAQWKSASPLPGWTVQDVVAHITTTELLLLGRAETALTADAVADYEHVTSPLREMIEVPIEARRSCPGAEVHTEFVAITSERLDALYALDDAGLDAPSWTPSGEGTVRDLLAFRIVDCWIHEQDLRLALDRPGGWNESAAIVSLVHLMDGMGKVVAKRVRAPEATVVRWRVGESAFVVEVRDGRGVPTDAQREATTTLSMDKPTFFGLAAGRGDRAALVDAVQIEGDRELGIAVALEMNVLF